MSDLQQAVKLIQEDQLPAARRLVLQILKDAPDEKRAWLCLTRCAADREQFDIAVRNVIRLEPDNSYARELATKYDVALYTDEDQGMSALKRPTPARQTQEVDEALQSIRHVLAPVEQKVRVTPRKAERARRQVPQYMDPRKRRFLRRVRFIGIVAAILIAVVVAMAFANTQQEAQQRDDLETRMVLEAQAATIERLNANDLATVGARATVFFGTETAIALNAIVISDAEVVFIGSRLVERRSTFDVREAIGVEYEPGPRVSDAAQLEIRVIRTDTQSQVTAFTGLLTETTLVRIDPPNGSWPAGRYQLEFWVDGVLVLSRNAIVEAG